MGRFDPSGMFSEGFFFLFLECDMATKKQMERRLQLLERINRENNRVIKGQRERLYSLQVANEKLQADYAGCNKEYDRIASELKVAQDAIRRQNDEVAALKNAKLALESNIAEAERDIDNINFELYNAKSHTMRLALCTVKRVLQGKR